MHFTAVAESLVENPSVPPSAFEQISQWVSSSSAAAFSFWVNIVSLALAVAGFALYFSQKRQYRLLFAILEEYGIRQKEAETAKVVKEEKSKAEEALAATKQEIESARKELAERLPQEAKRAYLESTIPVVEQQIFDLGQRLGALRVDLSRLTSEAAPASAEIQAILANELRKHVGLRYRLDDAQSGLTVLTALAAAFGSLPFFYDVDIWTPVFAVVGALIFMQALKLYKLHRLYFRELNTDHRLRPNKAAPADQKASLSGH